MIIGLTGGIGSGKSTVAKIFQALGAPVFIADDQAKRLLDEDDEVKEQLISLLGNEVLDEGRINRSYMAQRIFGDEQLLAKVNLIVHPAVGKVFRSWYQKHRDKPYVLREAAILFETNGHKDCDKVVVVTAPEELRLNRVIKRSGESEEQVKLRMKRQFPQEYKDKLADFLIFNDGQKMLIPQVKAVHESLIRIANSRR